MSAQQARAKIGEMLNNGVISFEEAKRHHDRISKIVYMKISQTEKESLYAVWAK